ncbi:MAG TPA: hypothetical protein VFU74_11915 [Actinocrinis sp.]|nr:hypothetical protein [Actinocrinis sp.]
MSAYHQIFVRTAEPPETLLADLAELCNEPFKRIDDGPVDYASHTATAFIDVELHHDFDADRDMPFNEYPWLITLRDRERDQDRQQHAARQVFDALAATGRYRLMLVHDLQRLLATYPPA